MIYIVPLPWAKPPLLANVVQRSIDFGYRGQLVRTAKEEAQWAVKAARIPRLSGALITLHFRPDTRHRRDADGIFPTLKVCQDALVLEGVLPDDSWVHVPSSTCHIHPPTPKDGPSVWLEVDALGLIA